VFGQALTWTVRFAHTAQFLLEHPVKPPQKTLKDFRWIPLDGDWDAQGEGLCFSGGETEPPNLPATPVSVRESTEPRAKFVKGGTVIFGQPFREGTIGVEVDFSEVDYRSSAGIVIQYNPETKDLLTFLISGGQLLVGPSQVGYLFKLQSWESPQGSGLPKQGNTSDGSKVWRSLFEVGFGTNLRPNRPYYLEVVVRGSQILLRVDGVEIGKHSLAVPSLNGNPCGLFSLSHSKIKFDKISVQPNSPRAFVAMQFQTPNMKPFIEMS
jgi:hypothetical protein